MEPHHVHKSSYNRTIPKRYLRYTSLALFFILAFRIFQYFPGMQKANEIWIIIISLFLAMPYFSWKVRLVWRFSLFEIYTLFIIFFIPVLSGLTAWREFGQPVIYGFLTERNMIIGGSALALIYSLRRGLVYISDIEKVLKILAWSTFVLYIFIDVLFDPAQFSHYHGGFVGGGIFEDFTFKFDTLFIIFGFFYYIFQGFRRKSLKLYFFSFVLLAYLVIGGGGRSLLLSVLLAYAFFIYRWSSFTRLVVLLPKIVISGLIMLLLVYLINPEYIFNLISKFLDAFTVVFTGQRSGDVSANARLVETAIAIPYILKHWLLGNGSISNQWHGGYEGVMGAYFFPSDIGIIGVIYLYGFLGMTLFSIQFLFAYRFSKQIAKYKLQSPLIDATKGFLFFYAIHSLVTGKFVHYSAVSMTFVSILAFITSMLKMQNLTNNTSK